MVFRLDLHDAKIPKLTDRLVEGMAEAAHVEFQEVYSSMMKNPPKPVPWDNSEDQHKIAMRAATRASYKYMALAGGAIVRR